MRPSSVLSLGQDLSPTEKQGLNYSCKQCTKGRILKAMNFAFEKYLHLKNIITVIECSSCGRRFDSRVLPFANDSILSPAS